ncbi:MAG: hypothetical protein P1V51_20030 [Deltaproteobacteria bacterium]|nr:hypothetical protein [Deltaproteobacteria bacterium]
MSVHYKSLDWIVKAVDFSRMITEATRENDKALTLTISFGAKRIDEEGVPVLGLLGAELWDELVAKTYPATLRDIYDFSVAINHPESPFRPAAPEATDFLSLDALVSGPMYQFALWMFAQGRWIL